MNSFHSLYDLWALRTLMNNKDQFSKNEKFNIFLPLLIAIALSGGVWLGLKLSNNKENSHLRIGKVDEILQFIDARYMENKASDELKEIAIRSILNELDPHSNYISLKEIQQVNESLSGNFDGIGIEFYLVNDTIYVVGVIEDGPSQKAGLEKGDKIISVNDSIVAGVQFSNEDVIALLKGQAGTKVELDVLKNGNTDPEKVTIERGHIPMRSVDVAYMLDEQTGLIKINRFSSTTYNEFMSELQDLVEKSDMKHLVLDLRHNPGGYLDAATKILDQLFPNKELLVYTQGRTYSTKEYFSSGKNIFDISKVAVLIDENSASASEIIAGAIQDNDRGIIIGRRSFGKGLVQEQYSLTDGSALRLTVAKYFTPSGRYIQKPYDKEVDYEGDLKNRFYSGELYEQDSVQVNDSTQYRTKSGRIVKGGGGIYPDVFVPIDTNLISSYYLILSSYIKDFAYIHLDQNKIKILDRFPEVNDFILRYQMSEELYMNYLTFLGSKEFQMDQLVDPVHKTHIMQLFKAHIADQLFSKKAFFKILFKNDPMIESAIEKIKE